MRQSLLFAFVFLLGSFGAKAQQAAQYTQFTLNPFILNPAVAGMHDYLDLNMGFRRQWAGFDQAPQTYYFSAHKPLNKVVAGPYKPLGLRISDPTVFNDEILDRVSKVRHGVGGYVLVDEYGAFTKSTINGAYAPHFMIGKKNHLSLGISLGLSNLRFDRTRVQLLDPNDPQYQQFLVNNSSTTFADINLGAYFYSDDYFIGYSGAQLLENKVYFGNPNNAQLELHHFFMAGFTMPVNDDISLTPSLMVKHMRPAPISFDLNLMADIRDQYWAGFSFRNKDAISFLFGLKFKEIYKFGYSYDVTISNLKSYNSGGHEILFGLMLGK